MSWLDRPLVRQYPDGTLESALDDVVGAELGLLSPTLGPVQLGVVVPTVLSSSGEFDGASLADIRILAPLSVGSDTFVARLTPTLRLPTGNPDRYLGDPGVGGGALASLHGRAGLLVAGADAGVDLGATTDDVDWPGGTVGVGAASVGVVPLDALGVHLGWRTRFPVSGGTLPSELGAAAKVRGPAGSFASLGGSRALTRGIGAPVLRAELTLGWSPQPATELAPEIVGDDDEPEATPVVRVAVTDASGRPVRGVDVVFASGERATTDADGLAEVPAGAAGPVTVEAPGFLAAEAPLQPEGPEQQLSLVRPPVGVAIRAVDSKGVVLTGAGVVDPLPPEGLEVDGLGTWRGVLPPGTWTITHGGEGLVEQVRTVVVDADRLEPVEVDAVLAPVAGDGKLSVSVVDPLGRPVDQARLSLGGQALGATSTGGDLVVTGLASQAMELAVDVAPWHDPEPVSVVPGPDATVRIVVGWPDGAAMVRASGPDGTVTDALVAFRGPAALPPAPLGPDGERLFTLRPGTWTVLVSSPTLGAQERRFTLAEDAEEPTSVDVVLQRGEGGDADLQVLVVGPEGPVRGAAVSLDGLSLGLTGDDGSLRALGLGRGSRGLEVTSQLMRPYAAEVVLFGGGQAVDVPITWAPGAVEVTALDPDSLPVDALVAARGPTPLNPLPLGPDGVERMQLAPGRWDLAISSTAWGTQIRTLTVREDEDVGLRRVRVRLLAPDDAGGGLRLTVRDPDGAPVEGARVTFGGQPLGSTTEGTLQAQSLARTTAEVRVEADGLQPAVQRVRITEDTPVDMALDWAPGALRVDVTGPTGPVDAVLAASGPGRVSPRRTGPDGRALLGLTPGAWRVLASSADLGAAEVETVLGEEAELSTVSVKLAAPGTPDRAALLVRVRDLDGAPVPGVSVQAGEQSAETSGGGSALITDLAPGPLVVTIAGAGFSSRELALDLPAGSHERIVVVERQLRTLVVRVVDADGKPVAARVFAEGHSSAAGEASRSEPARLQLVPGRWSLSARSDAGVASETVVVPTEGVVPEVQLVVARTDSRFEGATLVIGKAVPFDLDQATLRADAEPILDDVARLLKSEAGIRRVEIQGHTDDLGGVEYNQDLSERRANAVREALVARGIDPERLISRGYGLMRPVAVGTDEPSRAANRRVEIIVLERSDASGG